MRAETGSIPVPEVAVNPTSFRDRLRSIFDPIRPLLHFLTTGERYDEAAVLFAKSEREAREVIDSALQGKPSARRRLLGEAHTIIMAAHPITSSSGA